jgi:hypothetical protein
MSREFESIDEAIMALGTPGTPDWAAAFGYLSRHPETAEMMLATFRETLAQMGVAPTGTDPQTGEPVFSLEDVARAMGMSEQDLHVAVEQAQKGQG